MWFNKNQKIIAGIAVGIVVVIGAFLAYRFLYQQPRDKSASEAMFAAERYFDMDSLDIALNGDGVHLGFLDVIDNFGGTDAANLSHYYVGIINLKKGNYSEAIDQLKRFKSNELIVTPLALSAIGDAYAELGDEDEALAYYKKSIKSHPNDIVTPAVLMKIIILNDKNGNYKSALDYCRRLQENYTQSQHAREIDKYIAMFEAKLQ